MNGKFLTGKINGGVGDKTFFAANKFFLIFSIRYQKSIKKEVKVLL